MAEEELHLDTSMDRGLIDALAELSRRVEGVEGSMDDLRRAGKRAGDGVADGMDQATRSTDRARRAANAATPAMKRAGDAASRSGRQARVAASGWDRYSRSTNRSMRSTLRLGVILSAYKWAAIATGLFALAGGMSALAAGAAIAIGGLTPIVGVLTAIPTLLLAVKLSLWSVKLAAESLEPPLTRIKNQFTELGPVIAGGGLRSGLDYFADSLERLASLTGRGLAALGGEIGKAARYTGDLVKSRAFLSQVHDIFAGMRPIVNQLAFGIIHLARATLNFVQASLPMVQKMATAFHDAMYSLAQWSAESLRNGTLTQRLLRMYTTFTRVIGVLVDVFMGLFNIFRIGAGYSAAMGRNIEQNAAAFRQWTESAQGQERINRYFQESLPALREMGRLLGNILAGLGSLGANQNVAPLIAQINDELGPALANLINGFAGQGGLGPALISAASAIANLIAMLDLGVLVAFADAVAATARAVMWVSEEIPGAGSAIGMLLSAFLAFKLLGPVFALISMGWRAFKWMRGAIMLSHAVTTTQLMLSGIVVPTLRTLAKLMGGLLLRAITAVGMALKAAFITSPIGWVVLAIAAVVAGVIWLWNNVEWFRDAVIAVWEWIKNAALTAWEWIKSATATTVQAIVGYAMWVRDRAVAVWNWIRDAAVAVWSAISTAFQNSVNFIVMVAKWIWDHGLKQTLGVIVAGFEIAFNVVKFIVQTVVYIIMAIVALLAKTLEVAWKSIVAIATIAWKGIAAGALWLWENAIEPVITFFRDLWTETVALLSQKWQEFVGVISAVWSGFWNGFLKPIIDVIVAAWIQFTTLISNAWTLAVGWLSSKWTMFYTTVVQPVITWITNAWNNFVSAISAAWERVSNGIANAWNMIRLVANTMMGGIQDGWDSLTSWLGDVFEPVGNAISSVWEFISSAGQKAADIVKGAWDAVVGVLKGVWNFIADIWNSIPSVTVPDWVPFVGGSTFSLPKLPMLYAGGVTPGGPALVGEHGPELLVRSGRVVDTLGVRGPEVRELPRGGYVVPNLATMTAGLAKPLPAPVAAAVTRSAPEQARAGARHDPALARAIRDLAASVRANRPLHVDGGQDVEEAVSRALRKHERAERARRPYEYSAGSG